MYEFLSTKVIAETLDIPRPTLVKILQNLTIAGIVETKEGKQGGIRLAKKPSNITVLDVFKAQEIGKPLFQTSFQIPAVGKRPDAAQKSVGELLVSAEEAMKKTLNTKKISDILDEMGA